MVQVTTPSFDPEALKDRIMRERHGFLLLDQVVQLAAHATSRLWPMLVRCGGCRFVCAAQDVAHLIALVESGTDNGSTDYVRDVSFATWNTTEDR